MTHEQAPLQSELLHKAQTIIDVHEEVFPTSEIGLPSEDERYTFAVVGELTLGSQDEESASLALIRTVSKKSGVAELFVTGLQRDEQGNKAIAGAWEGISPDIKYTIGRGSVGEDEAKINGTKLFGTEFSDLVSRSHLTLELTREGELTLADNSTNGTEVRAVKKPVQETAQPTLIDHVPQNGDEAAAMIEQARLEELQPIVERIDEQIAKADELMKGFEERFGNDVSRSLRRFAFNKSNQGEEQRRGHADAAKNYEQVAGKVLEALPPEARAVSAEYLQLFNHRNELIARRSNMLSK